MHECGWMQSRVGMGSNSAGNDDTTTAVMQEDLLHHGSIKLRLCSRSQPEELCLCKAADYIPPFQVTTDPSEAGSAEAAPRKRRRGEGGATSRSSGRTPPVAAAAAAVSGGVVLP